MKKNENDVSPFPSKGHQAWNLSKATKHWNLPLATKQDVSPLAIKFGTFQGPLSQGLPSLPSFSFPFSFSFSFSLKAQIQIIWHFLFRHNFRFEFLKTYSYNFFWEEKNDQSQQMVEKGKINWMIVVPLKEWK